MGQWRTKARKIIGAALLEGKAQGIRGRALRRFIGQRYPEYSDTRMKYPYRVWLEELDKAMFQELNGCNQMVLGLVSG